MFGRIGLCIGCAVFGRIDLYIEPVGSQYMYLIVYGYLSLIIIPVHTCLYNPG